MPALQAVFGTASLPLDAVLLTLPFPLIVWAVDAWVRSRQGRRSSASATAVTSRSTGWSERSTT